MEKYTGIGDDVCPHCNSRYCDGTGHDNGYDAQMYIELKDTSDTQIFHSGENTGKLTGVKRWQLLIDGEVRGSIYCARQNNYQVTANSYKHGLGARFFKTFTGAKKWLIKFESAYKPFAQAIQEAFYQ